MGTLSPLNLAVPGDPSSAAFLLGAAAIVPGSALTLTGVSTNPLRIGFITMLQEMGADITLTNPRLQGGEPVADIVVRHAPLRAVDIPASRAPSMIDEYLIAAVVAAFATGTSVFRGLAELRVKESDRLAAAAEGLKLCGVTTRIDGDDLHVVGCGAAGVPGGATILAQLDHRIAMSFLVMGMASQQPVQVDDVRPVLTSFPNFVPLFQQLGARLQLV
jgi:3-phosphoshikimate 1-carboxyvinyltransferase